MISMLSNIFENLNTSGVLISVLLGPRVWSKFSWFIPRHERDIFRARGARQRDIEGRKRQLPTLGEFKMSRIISRKGETFAQAQRRRPRLPVGFGIDRNHQRLQIGQRGVPVGAVDALAPHRHLKPVQDFQAPQRAGTTAAASATRLRTARLAWVFSSSKYHASVIEQSRTRLTDALHR